ncbi:MAG: electron transfer flavoprotein subunit alpha/FixB family protein [Desulfatibacillum sp.]|nr:electron transfer flavoprotein subunit alpha/FixB family protein [Desulfatibacillum sp.]
MSTVDKRALVVAEHKDGKITPATLEALECARILSGSLDNIHGIVLAGEAEKLAGQLGDYGVQVTGFSGKFLKNYTGEAFLEVILDCAKQEPYAWIILPHTSLGMDLGPALAAHLGAAFVPGAQEVRPEENLFIRPVFNGKFSREVRPLTETIVVGALPGSFAQAEKAQTPGKVGLVTVDKAPARTVYVGAAEGEGPDLGLAQAQVVICGGRGMGGEDNVPLLEETAALFPRSAVAGSRIACDMGWLPYKAQIGVTGQTVAPKFYMGCGVSGAFQHVVGMSGSQFVVAVNTDPQAPIFSIADYCIVEDVMEFLPAFVKAAREKE